jgi:hypothetical protein
MPDDPAKFTEDYNRRAFLSNFPPDKRWERITGLQLQDRSEQKETLVSIAGNDHEGEYTTIWIDLPNAMYLLGFLAQIQRETRAAVPNEQPGNTNPHPSA